MEKPRPRSTGLLRFQGGTSDGRETVTIKLNASEFGCVPGGVGFGRRPFPFVTLASLSNSRRNPASTVDAQPGFPQPDQVLIPGGDEPTGTDSTRDTVGCSWNLSSAKAF